jgi:hypothetical protein
MKPRVHDQATSPSEAEIQHEAYRLWLEGGRQEGVELENWFAAKERLMHHHGPATTKAPRTPGATPAKTKSAPAQPFSKAV